MRPQRETRAQATTGPTGTARAGSGRLRAPLLAVALALGALAGCSREPVEIKIGAPAPGFALADLGGERVDHRSFAGTPVVLNFWATWCQPCRREMPELEAASRELDARVVGIALDDEAAPVARYVEAEGIGYTVLMGDQRTFAAFDGYAIPYTLLLDAEWKIANIYRRQVTKAELEADLARLAPDDRRAEVR